MRKLVLKKNRTKRPVLNFIIIIIILTLLIGIPYVFLNYQARKNGTSPGRVLKWMLSRTSSSDSLSTKQSAVILTGEKIDFLIPGPIGQEFTEPPMISNLAAEDMDGDGLLGCSGL